MQVIPLADTIKDTSIIKSRRQDLSMNLNSPGFFLKQSTNRIPLAFGIESTRWLDQTMCRFFLKIM